MGQIHATTIFAIHHNGGCAMAGDGQVTLSESIIFKNNNTIHFFPYDDNFLDTIKAQK